MNGAPGRRTRQTSAKTSSGCSRYWTLTVQSAASNDASAKGSVGVGVQVVHDMARELAFAAISASLMPRPVTRRQRARTSGGRWVR